MEDTAKKGDYVQIKVVILEPKDRSVNLPPDTAELPYVALIKGFLQDEAAGDGQKVTILSPAGRVFSGEMLEVNPLYGYDFGRPVPELFSVGPELQELLQTERKEKTV
jgi:hypothetical protein